MILANHFFTFLRPITNILRSSKLLI